MKKTWWKEAVAYQIYPRSFMDSNGDGIGDIRGIISKLDYLKELGVDIIWICPIFSSPNDDNGYDISDYKGIMQEFGTMSDFDELLKEVHSRKMKLVLDLVINHTSDEHPWFIASRSSKESPYRDYYIWHPGRDGKEPNNWESIFGGSAWEYDAHTQEYYMHIFSRKQPDLNWENQAVRNDLYDMVNWWLDKGIDGFRVDAISHIKKVKGFPDMPNPDNKRYVSSFDGHMNRDGIHEYLQELKGKTFAKYDVVTVGEANGVTVEEADQWVGENKGAFDMIFQFEHLDLWGKSKDNGLDLEALKTTFTKWQNGLHEIGWNALFLENHDQPRSVSTWGNSEEYREESAKCLSVMYFLMQGTPFIYQGQEIGMTNVAFQTIDDYHDVAIKNLYQQELEAGTPIQEIMEIIWLKGRDNSRTPMQWNNKKNAGFTTGTPWIKLNPNYESINIEQAKSNPNSVYYFYRDLIQLRKKESALIYGEYAIALKDHDKIYAYTRTFGDESLLILCNLFASKTTCSLSGLLNSEEQVLELVIANYEVEETEINDIVLSPYETRVYRITNS